MTATDAAEEMEGVQADIRKREDEVRGNLFLDCDNIWMLMING